MIIDVSNIIGHHRFKDTITAEDLLKQMDNAGIDMAVIMSHAESMDNRTIEDAMNQYPDRFIGLYTVNPWNENSAEELEKAFERGFKGLHMNPNRHGYMLCEYPVFYPLLKVCETYHLPVWCYGAAEVFSNPVFFSQIAKDFPDVNIIMGRMGLQYDNASAVQVASEYKNIYLETSSSMDFNVHRAIKAAGVDKVLLGTGTPEAGYFEMELVKVRNAARIYPGGETKILGDNAARIFHIVKESHV